MTGYKKGVTTKRGSGPLYGHGRILERIPVSLHTRTPLIIGGRKNVEQVVGFVDGSPAGE